MSRFRILHSLHSLSAMYIYKIELKFQSFRIYTPPYSGNTVSISSFQKFSSENCFSLCRDSGKNGGGERIYLDRGTTSKRGGWPPILLWRGRMKDAKLDLGKWHLAHFRMAAQVEAPSKNYPCFWSFSIVSSSLIRIHRSLRPPARMILAETPSQKMRLNIYR